MFTHIISYVLFKIMIKLCLPCRKHTFMSFKTHCLMHMFALWENNKNKR